MAMFKGGKIQNNKYGNTVNEAFFAFDYYVIAQSPLKSEIKMKAGKSFADRKTLRHKANLKHKKKI